MCKILPKMINGFSIIQDFGYIKGSRRALVECKICQRKYETDPNKLKYRKHCGCIKNGSKVCKYTRSHPRLLQAYKHMMARCYNKKNKDYYNYGARNIYICDEWYKKPDVFCEWALKNGYQENLLIDRKDNIKGYFPENCRWTTAVEQARNTRRNVLTMELANQMRAERRLMTYKKLAEKYKVSISTVGAVLSDKIWRQ